jgi:hypothetical protein
MGSATLPGREIRVDVACCMPDVEILDGNMLSDHIYIGFVLDYEYGARSKKSGLYQGLFEIYKLSYPDTLEYDIFLPLLSTIEEEFE